MDTVAILLVILIIIAIINIILVFKKRIEVDIKPQLKDVEDSVQQFKATLELVQKSIKEEFKINREETAQISKENREELANSLKSFEQSFSDNIAKLNDLLRQQFEDLNKNQNQINKQVVENIRDVRNTIEKQLGDIREDNNKQLDEMRKTVDEKLQKTLNERLSQSFETVGKQLQAVQEGLGEMKNLANDVGGLKKVLGNVKLRGGFGEVQLEMLLEQILAPEQYDTDVKTKEGSRDNVEFAIKLPGKDDTRKQVWLPVDAKFPKDVYQQLQDAYEEGDPDKMSDARKNLENTIKKMAKDISEKYIDPPNTTDFAIMFLPFEGIYAEVVRDAALLEELRNKFKVIVTGPTTLAAFLNSLQMGFKTLAIEKRSSEVWRILGAVKNEFEKFGGMLDKAQKNIRTGLNQLDDIRGTRTRAIERKLKDVESLTDTDSGKIFPELDDERNALPEGSD
jgi:DNA recombination protein RmuC